MEGEAVTVDDPGDWTMLGCTSGRVVSDPTGSSSGREILDGLASTEMMENWRSVEMVEVVEACLDRMRELERELDEADEVVAKGFIA